MRSVVIESNRLRRAALSICCSRSGLSFVCGGMCRGTTATYSAVPTRVEMRRSVGGSIVTITYTEEGIESSEQQKKKREGSGGRSSVRVCLNSVCLQRVSSVQDRCGCLSFGCFYNASCEVEQRMVVWRVERCDWAEREERVVPRRRDETVNERGTATREHGHG